jgi:pyrimidine-specific ribonucleoside hydrolase
MSALLQCARARVVGAAALACLALVTACGGGAAAVDDAGAACYPIVIDTDAGADDLMALAYLLVVPDVRIEAITMGVGLAHIERGAHNLLRVLELAGRRDIPVYLGRATPLAGERAFPAPWRALSDDLPGVELPAAHRLPETRPAAEFLAARLSDAARPVDVLALGALTNIAEALELRRGTAALQRLVIMGGAVDVPGNLHEAGENENVTAEWNFYVDAEAARRVFDAGLPIRLVPLDATDLVPFDRDYIRQFAVDDQPRLARLVAELLEMVGFLIDVNNFYAWDVLAAMTLVDSTVVRLRPAAIAIRLEPPEDGRSAVVADRAASVQLAYDADEPRFRELLVSTLLASGTMEREP